MPNPSNLYAEKIFSEHPAALWALDDQVDFISLIDKNDKRFIVNSQYWSISGGTVSSSIPANLAIPIDNAPTRKIVSNTASNKITLTSREIINFQQMDLQKDSFNVGLYFQSETPNIENVKIGYTYDSLPPVFEEFEITVDNNWLFLNKTFELPAVNKNVKIVIEINFIQSIPTGSNFNFYINGLSFGQWSEEFNVRSTGIDLVSIPSTIATSVTQGVEARAYGLRSASGYYVASNKRLLASNSGIPMVYGASNVTRLFPNNNEPSLIIPGFGFMNETGKFKELTFEMWLRIDPQTTTPKRIFGPIGKVYENSTDTVGQQSTDGLYVDGPFLVLKVGQQYGSYFVSEWGRPMLLQIRFINNGATMLINGEEVLSLNLISSDLNFASRLSRGASVKDQDWLGFYSYNDISSFEIDSVAVYSYQVPEVVAKRRLVYGQGVDFPENLNTGYNGTSAFIDYKVAGYSNNYSYPDIGRWQQGIVENISTIDNMLSAPAYQLPEVVLSSGTTQEWLDQSYASNNSNPESSPYVVFNSNGYLSFSNFRIIDQPIKGFYGVFKSTSTANQVLFRVEDEATKNFFLITVEDQRITYRLSYGSLGNQIIYQDDKFVPGLIFSAGIDIDKFSNTFSQNVATFFGNPGRLKVYVGGQPGFENSFIGKVFKVGFSTKRNINQASLAFKANGTTINEKSVFLSYFNNGAQIPFSIDGGYYNNELDQWVLGNTVLDGGTPASFASLQLINHTASYTLIARDYLNSFSLDIATDSYWQDYIPLKYFGKFVKDIAEDSIYDLDFLQFNIGYPNPEITNGSNYDTSKSLAKTYITFQYLATGANRSDQVFTYTQPISAGNVIRPGSNWLNTRYEVVDDTIIYLPSGVNFSQIAIVTHVQLLNNGILKSPVKIKTLQIAGQASDALTPAKVNTRFGVPIFPYKKRGIYLDYKADNPYTIYKNSTPYLYLTKNSGIRLRDSIESMKDRGLRIPINSNFAPSYRVGAMQLSVKYTEKLFPTTPTEVFEIDSRDPITRRAVILKGYVVAANQQRTRGRLYILNNTTGLPFPGLYMYLNGVMVQKMYINLNEWNMIGIQFQSALEYDSYAGSININGPILVNNISSYQLSAIQKATTFLYRTWAQVPRMLDKTDNPATPEIDESLTVFGDFLAATPDINWENVLFILVEQQFTLDPEVIYNSYLGTNKIIAEDNQVLSFKDYTYRVYKNASWQSRVLTAV